MAPTEISKLERCVEQMICETPEDRLWNEKIGRFGYIREKIEQMIK
jgi:hypothetical protein